MVSRTIEIYSRLDVLVYNSGAIWWASVEQTPLSRFQLMQRVDVECLYATVQAALPHLSRGANNDSADQSGRIVVGSPPIYSRLFRGMTAYAMGKVAMSVLTQGLAMDFAREGRTQMALTSLWPAVAIESAATARAAADNPSLRADLRRAAVFSDAVLAVLRASPPSRVNGLLALDDDFLRAHAGVTDFGAYAVVPGATPRRIMPAVLPGLTVAEQDDEGQRMDSTQLGKAEL